MGFPRATRLVVMAPSAEVAKQALEQLKSWADQAGLTLHPDKTRLVDMTESRAHFDFLGYRFLRTAKGKMIRLVRPKSKKKLRESLRNPTKRANGRSLEHIIAILNPKLQGWFAYLMQAHLSEPLLAVERRLEGVPADLKAPLLRCLARDPDERFPSAAAFSAALAECDASQGWDAEAARGWWQSHLDE